MKATTVIAIFVGLYLIHRTCLWLESKGWLYYCHNKPKGGFLASALLGLNFFFDPSIRHTIKAKQNQVQLKRSEADTPGDPLDTKTQKKN